MDILSPSVAIARAEQLSFRYRRVLDVSTAELPRYHAKALNLAWCYVGFRTRLSLDQAVGAGSAGFISAAYDVVTDWKEEGEKDWVEVFRSILLQEATGEQVNLAMDLLQRDVSDDLKDDGLERGAIALEFVLDMMGIKQELAKEVDIYDLGLLLQIVDDVLDYEEDSAAGHTNCLTSNGATFYLQRLRTDLTDGRMDALFPRGHFLRKIVKKARVKASSLEI